MMPTLIKEPPLLRCTGSAKLASDLTDMVLIGDPNVYAVLATARQAGWRITTAQAQTLSNALIEMSFQVRIGITTGPEIKRRVNNWLTALRLGVRP